MKLRLLLMFLTGALFSIRVHAKIDTNTVNQWNDQALDLAYSEPKKGMELAEKAYKEAQRLHFSRGEVRALIRMGIIYDVQSKNKQAIEKYELSLKLAQKTNDVKAIASNLNNLGLIYWKVNELNKSLDYLVRAYSLFRHLKDEYNMASSSNNIGLIYEELQLSKKALYWHRKAITHCQNAGEEPMLFDVYSNMGNTFENEHNKDSSRYYTLLAIQGFRKMGNKYGLGISLNNLGISYNSENKPKQAIPYYEESIQVAKELGNQFSVVSTGTNLASSYNKLGLYKDEKRVYEELYPLLNDLNSKELGFKVCYGLAQCCFREQNYSAGEQLMKQYHSYHDAYFKELLNKNIEETEKKFQLHDMRQRAKLMQQKAAFQIKRQENKRYTENVIWTASLGLIMLTGLLFFFIVRKRNLQQELVNQKAVFDATTEERKRISYDLHDHVGSQLSYVVNNLELIQHTDKADERVQRTFAMSQAAMSSLRDTVWALHTEELTIQSLIERMKNVARKTVENDTSLNFSLESTISSDQIIPPQATMHIMRIFQEAIHNILKHAKASQITVMIYETATELIVEVNDNGIGIGESPQKPFHYGLQSMQDRAGKINGVCVIATNKAGGTTVRLNWPKNNSNA